MNRTIDISSVSAEYLESRIARLPESGCWLWTGVVNDRGYGILHVYIGDQRKQVRAHRMTFKLYRGQNEMSDFIRTCPIGICLVQAGQECVCLAPLPPSNELPEPRTRGDEDTADDSTYRSDRAKDLNRRFQR